MQTPAATREIVIPVAIPAIKMPAIALFGTARSLNALQDGYAERHVLMISATSDVKSVQEVLQVYNDLLRALETLLGVLGVATNILSAVLSPLKLLIETIRKAPFPPAFVVGSVEDFDNHPGTERISGGGFDNENTSMLLIGPTSMKVRLIEFPGADSDDQCHIEPVSLTDVLAGSGPKAKFVRAALGLGNALILDPPVKAILDTLQMGVTFIPNWEDTSQDAALKGWFHFGDDEEVFEDADAAYWV